MENQQETHAPLPTDRTIDRSGNAGASSATAVPPMVDDRPDLANAQWAEVASALSDVRQFMGFVPEPIARLTEESVPGAWQETRDLFFSTNTALEPKVKDLISLAIAAQIPCQRSLYFDSRSSQENGATATERTEALLMAALTRHWSTVLNGSQMDMETFRAEIEQIFEFLRTQRELAGDTQPARETFLVRFSGAQDTYKDIERTLGLVPRFLLAFPEEGLPGAWSEFKAVQLNPYTQLSPRIKELIALGVASQIPCAYCIHFHREAARLNGASDREIQEVLGVAAIERHWSTLFNGLQIEPQKFMDEAERILDYAHQGGAQDAAVVSGAQDAAVVSGAQA